MPYLLVPLPGPSDGAWKAIGALGAAVLGLCGILAKQWLGRKRKPEATAELDESRARAVKLLAEAQTIVADVAVKHVVLLMERMAVLEKTQFENVQRIAALAVQSAECHEDKAALAQQLTDNQSRFAVLEEKLRQVEQKGIPDK